uniref:hypothetical protein n=1 Tax=Pseudanabaena sp. 'Roaring Creek' TaxID=1681830 RepID=UPI000A690622
FGEQTAFEMQTDLGSYYLRFKPVYYHQGLFVEIWQWVSPPPPPNTKWLGDLSWSPNLAI